MPYAKFEKMALVPHLSTPLMKPHLKYLTKLTEELQAYLEKTRAISPQMLEAEGLCGGCLGFYMVKGANESFHK